MTVPSHIPFDLDIPTSFGRLRGRMLLPNREMRLAELAWNLMKVDDQLVGMGVACGTGSHSGGLQISCSKGCGACCRQLVPLSPPEVFMLADVVLRFPAARSEAVIVALRPDPPGIAQGGHRGGGRPGQGQRFGHRGFVAQVLRTGFALPVPRRRSVLDSRGPSFDLSRIPGDESGRVMCQSAPKSRRARAGTAAIVRLLVAAIGASRGGRTSDGAVACGTWLGGSALGRGAAALGCQIPVRQADGADSSFAIPGGLNCARRAALLPLDGDALRSVNSACSWAPKYRPSACPVFGRTATGADRVRRGLSSVCRHVRRWGTQ